MDVFSSQGITAVAALVVVAGAFFLFGKKKRDPRNPPLWKQKDVNVIVKRCGGAYGGKVVNSVRPAVVTALAAQMLHRPVRMVMTIEDVMANMGKRHPVRCDYELGVNSEGLLLAVDLMCYSDAGWRPQDYWTMGAIMSTVDNVYKSKSFRAAGKIVKTNTPSNTSCRGPGWTPAIFIAEHCMEHVAAYLRLPHDQVKSINFYKKNDVTPYHEKLPRFNIPTIWEQVKHSAQYGQRLSLVHQFNSQNRWIKKGISIVPIKFGLYWHGSTYGAFVSIFPDGSVTVAHSGTEIGQGINTKVAQVVVFELGVPLDDVAVESNSTAVFPQSNPTGGSTTSELCSAAAIKACVVLNGRIAPIRQALPPQSSWKTVIQKCESLGVDLSAKGWNHPGPSANGPQQYQAYAVCISEVRVDVLTGVQNILRSDILYDCGYSLNPIIDIGQAEGAQFFLFSFAFG